MPPLPQPANLTISNPTPETIQALTRLTKTLLPINYPDKFFSALLNPPSLKNNFSFAKVATWTDTPRDTRTSTSIQQQSAGPEEPIAVVVGGICGRVMPAEPDATGANSGECHLYIATLAVLAPWRGQGIAAALLRDLVGAAMEFTRSLGAEVGNREDANEMHSGATPTGGTMSQGSVSSNVPLGRLTGVYAHVWETNESGLDWYRGQGFEIGDVIKGYYRKLRPDGARIVRRGVVGYAVGSESIYESARLAAGGQLRSGLRMYCM